MEASLYHRVGRLWLHDNLYLGQSGDGCWRSHYEGESFILNWLVLAGGPPRSGTTLLARILNSYPKIITAIDISVYEIWTLFHYRARVGLVPLLRTREMSPEEVQRYLLQHIVRDDKVWGIAPSEKGASCPLIPPPTRPYSTTMNRDHAGLRRSFVVKAKRVLKKSFVHKSLFTQKPAINHQGLMRRRIPLEFFRNVLCLCLKSPEIVFVLPQLATA